MFCSPLEGSAGRGEPFPRKKKSLKSPKMREEGSARAQAQSGPREFQMSDQRDTQGARDRDAPAGGLVGVEGAGVRRHRVRRRALTSSPPERLAQAIEGRAQRAAPAKVRAAASAPCGASARGSPALAPAKSRSLAHIPVGWPPEQPGYTCCTRRCRWEVLRRSLR